LASRIPDRPAGNRFGRHDSVLRGLPLYPGHDQRHRRATTVDGTDDADTINGNSQNNTINGKGGNDVLVGLAGNDTLLGGAANDTYRFGAEWGQKDGSPSTETDYYDDNQGDNTLDFKAVGAAVMTFKVTSTGSGNSTKLIVEAIGERGTTAKVKSYLKPQNNPTVRYVNAANKKGSSEELVGEIAGSLGLCPKPRSLSH
jgi:Ca2+-binding RTX toxin-like protein